MSKLSDASFFKKYAVNIGIGAISLLIIHNFCVALYGSYVLDDRNEFISQRIDINNRLAELDRNVNLMDLGFRGYFMMKKEGFKVPYTRAVDIYGQNLDTLKQALTQMDYPDLGSVDYVKDQVKGYAKLVGQGIELVEAGQPDQAVDLFESDPGYGLWVSYNPKQVEIAQFVAEKESISKTKYQSVTGYSFFAQLLTLTLGAPILIFVIFRLRKNDNRMQALFSELDESNQSLIYYDGNVKKGALQGDEVISRIIGNLKKATSFIQDITKGNLDVTWQGDVDSKEGQKNHETLVGELIKMRDQMKNVRSQEEIRYWTAQGISKFSQIVRDNQDDLKELTDRLISEVVKYTDSKQGGLFLINDDNMEDQFLELTSTYAYERRKFLQKRIEIGQGILGEVYMEGQTAMLKEIPQNYLNITSGLGHALPSNLIIVPIKLNEDVRGVIELASFDEYEEHKIELLEKIGEIVASAIINGKTAIQTKQLLELSQQNEEEMKSQEEEMRQNMEELQATQEQEQRTRTELEQRIKELELKLASR